MLFNLLTSVTDPTRTVSIGEAALYALLGFAVVFVGIAFLILIVWLVGKLMHKNSPQTTVKTPKAEPIKEVTESLAAADAEQISEETVAVITAAIMAYYQTNNPKCEFRVKRIKRI